MIISIETHLYHINKAWVTLKDIIKYFLCNQRSNNYFEMISELLHCLEELGARMSIKIQFLSTHLNYFPNNCGDYSEKQGDRFHQDIATMENLLTKPRLHIKKIGCQPVLLKFKKIILC